MELGLIHFVLLGFVFVELALLFLYPSLLARLAIIPLGKQRTFEIPPPPLHNSGGSLESSVRPLTLSSLPWPKMEMSMGITNGGHITGTNIYWMAMNQNFFRDRRPRGVGRVVASVHGRQVTLDSYWMPFPISIILLGIIWTIMAFANLSTASENAWLAPVFLVAALCATTIWLWFVLGQEAEAHMDHIERSMVSQLPSP